MNGPDPSKPTGMMMSFIILLVVVALLAGYWTIGYLHFW